jgi:polyisoprenoid-binding protein YceI
MRKCLQKSSHDGPVVVLLHAHGAKREVTLEAQLLEVHTFGVDRLGSNAKIALRLFAMPTPEFGWRTGCRTLEVKMIP